MDIAKLNSNPDLESDSPYVDVLIPDLISKIFELVVNGIDHDGSFYKVNGIGFSPSNDPDEDVDYNSIKVSIHHEGLALIDIINLTDISSARIQVETWNEFIEYMKNKQRS